MMHRCLSTFSILALSLPALAQSDEAPATQAAGPAIVLRTADMMPAMGMASRFDPNAQPPELGENQQYVVSLSSDGKVKITTAAATKHYLHATLHPKALMTMFKAQIDAQWGQVQGFAMMGLSQVGVSGKQAAIALNAVRNFPNQLASVDVTLNRSPNQGPKGLKINLDVRGTTGSWVARTINSLKAVPHGAPTIPAGKHMMQYRLSVAPEAMVKAFEPFMGFVGSMAGTNKEEREAAKAAIAKMTNTFGGSGAAWGNPLGGAFKTVMTSSDPKSWLESMNSGPYKKLMERMMSMQPGMDMEITPKVMNHREVEVVKLVTSSDQPNPAMPDGEIVQYAAAAGRYMVSSQGGEPKDIKAMIDMAMDNKFKSAPMAGNQLMTMSMRLGDLLETVIGMNPLDNAPGGSPETLNVDMSAKQGLFSFSLEFK